MDIGRPTSDNRPHPAASGREGNVMVFLKSFVRALTCQSMLSMASLVLGSVPACLADAYSSQSHIFDVLGGPTFGLDQEFHGNDGSFSSPACAGAVCPSSTTGTVSYVNPDGTTSTWSGAANGYASVGHAGTFASVNLTNIEPSNPPGLSVFEVVNRSLWQDVMTNTGVDATLQLTFSMDDTISTSGPIPTMYSGQVGGEAHLISQTGPGMDECVLLASGTCHVSLLIGAGAKVLQTGQIGAAFDISCVGANSNYCNADGSFSDSSFTATADALHSLDLIGASAVDKNGNPVDLSLFKTDSGLQLSSTGYVSPASAVPEPDMRILSAIVLFTMAIISLRRRLSQTRAADA
jgi:hypothetical protein